MSALALLVIAGVTLWIYGLIQRKFLFHGLLYQCSFSTDEACEGDEVLLRETVHNHKMLPVHWLKAEIHSSRWLAFANTRSVVAQEGRFVTSGYSLSGYQKTVRQWKVKCLKRGIFITENVTLAGGDFLGIVSSSIPVRVNARLVVYPGNIDLDRILIPTGCLWGETIVKRWILEDPFVISGTREYTQEDPASRIHWPSTVRHGKAMVRKNDFTAHHDLRVLLNIQSMEYEYRDVVDKDTVELCIKAAASVFNSALQNGVPVGLACNGLIPEGGERLVFTGMVSGRFHVAELLTLLASLQLRKTCEFEDCIDELAAKMMRSEVIVITSYLSKNLWMRIKGLKGRGNRIRIIVPERDELWWSPEPGMEVYLLPRV